MAGGAVIVAGLGFRRAATPDSLAQVLAAATGCGVTVCAIATAADKAASPAFQALALRSGLPVLAIAEAEILRQDTATRSAAALALRGTGSLAEAAALAGAGAGAQLIAPRIISADGMATCALAKGTKA